MFVSEKYLSAIGMIIPFHVVAMIMIMITKSDILEQTLSYPRSKRVRVIQISRVPELSLSLSPSERDVSIKLQTVTVECEFNKLITAPNFPITDTIWTA